MDYKEMNQFAAALYKVEELERELIRTRRMVRIAMEGIEDEDKPLDLRRIGSLLGAAYEGGPSLLVRLALEGD